MIFDKTKELLKEFNGEEYENTIVNNMQYAIESKNLIKQSLQNKGSEITDKTVFRDYYKEIDKLNEWQPHPDWWDIKKIIQEDTEDYPVKAILLLADFFSSETFTFNNSIVKIKTSDDAEYTSSSTHTWDLSQDKECSKGYKTRYIIVYFNKEESDMAYNIIDNNHKHSLLWFIAKGNVLRNYNASGNSFMQSSNLEAIEAINCDLRIDLRILNGTFKLKKLDRFYPDYFIFGENSSIKNICMNVNDIDYNDITFQYTFYRCYELETIDITGGDLIVKKCLNSFAECYNLKKIPKNFKFSNEINNFNNSFYSLYNLQEIESEINLENQQSNFNNFLVNCYSLRKVNLKNIKKSGLNVSQNTLLEKDVLLQILNELYDYSDQEEVYQIIFGNTNLSKLTDKEKQIATDKGWTLS